MTINLMSHDVRNFLLNDFFRLDIKSNYLIICFQIQNFNFHKKIKICLSPFDGKALFAKRILIESATATTIKQKTSKKINCSSFSFLFCFNFDFVLINSPSVIKAQNSKPTHNSNS